MKIFKRNQLIILIISFMLITAGYLNFTSNNEKSIQSSGPIAELGDATLVNTEVEVEQSVVKPENCTCIENCSCPENCTCPSDCECPICMQENNNTQETASPVEEDQYFTKSKLERDTMYSQMLETYQEIYNNPNSTSEQKTEAMKEISKINSIRNSIMIAENLVVVKGFEDIVIFTNNGSTSIIIKAKELLPEQIAQIQNIVSRELNVGVESINISTK